MFRKPPHMTAGQFAAAWMLILLFCGIFLTGLGYTLSLLIGWVLS